MQTSIVYVLYYNTTYAIEEVSWRWFRLVSYLAGGPGPEGLGFRCEARADAGGLKAPASGAKPAYAGF